MTASANGAHQPACVQVALGRYSSQVTGGIIRENASQFQPDCLGPPVSS
jgi:hypothetical protein